MNFFKALPYLLLVAFILNTPFASSAGDIGISVGAGILSDKGLIGAGVEVELPTQGYAKLDAGIDLSGLMYTLMYKHPFAVTRSGDRWYQRCFFLFSCESIFLAGAGLKYFNAHTSYIRRDTGEEARYHVGSKIGTGVTLTQKMEFTSGIFFDFDFSYRWILSGPNITLEEGQEQAKDRSQLTTFDDNLLGAGISMGYRF